MGYNSGFKGLKKTSACFGLHWHIVRECGWAKQSQGHAVISIIRNCGEIINV